MVHESFCFARDRLTRVSVYYKRALFNFWEKPWSEIDWKLRSLTAVRLTSSRCAYVRETNGLCMSALNSVLSSVFWRNSQKIDAHNSCAGAHAMQLPAISRTCDIDLCREFSMLCVKFKYDLICRMSERPKCEGR